MKRRPKEEVLTASQIESLYDSEWILVGNPETNEQLEVLRGKVLWHSKDRDELYRKAIELRPRDFAILYTGQLPEHMILATGAFPEDVASMHPPLGTPASLRVGLSQN